MRCTFLFFKPICSRYLVFYTCLPLEIANAPQFAFFIIAACGFGLPFNWRDPPRSVKGFSVQEALRLVLNNSLLQVMLPKWAYEIPLKRLQDVKTARGILTTFMREQIATKKAESMKPDLSKVDEEKVTKGMDIFTRLTRANEGESENSLKDDELVRPTSENN